MESFFIFFEKNYLGILISIFVLLMILIFIQWISWIFSIGRFKESEDKPRRRTDSLRFLIADLLVKIINDFRHLLALIMVVIFGLVLAYALIKFGNTGDDISKILQAVISTIGVLISSIIGYYFGETAAKKSFETKPEEPSDKFSSDETEIKQVDIPKALRND